MAAGLGFKTFTTGEVLTAADTNGYLMQGILVFASAAARDAAITSPQEGQFAYLKDTNVTTYYTGSAWANVDTTGMTNPMTTTGDTIYSSSGSTPARLGIGSTGNVLTVAGGVPTWAAPAGGGGMTVISSGNLTGTSISVTSISGYNDLQVVLRNPYPQSGGGSIQINVNSDTGGYYNKLMSRSNAGQTYTTGANGWGMDDAAYAPAAASNDNFYVLTLFDVANTTSQKMSSGYFVFTRSDSARVVVDFAGLYTNGTSAITAVGIKPESGSFGGGTYIVYGVK